MSDLVLMALIIVVQASGSLWAALSSLSPPLKAIAILALLLVAQTLLMDGVIWA